MRFPAKHPQMRQSMLGLRDVSDNSANREMGGKFCSSERDQQIWAFPKIMGFTLQIIHSTIGFSMIWNHPFWGTVPYFWFNIQIHKSPKICFTIPLWCYWWGLFKLLFFWQGAMYAKRKSLCHQSLSKKHAASDSARTISTNHEPVEKNCQEIPCLPVLPPMLLGCLRPASIDNSVDFPDPFFPTMPTLNKNAHPQAIRNLTDLSCGWWKQSLRNLKSAQQRIFLENSEIFVKNGCSLCSHSLGTKALCLTCWVLPRSPGRRALGHLLSCEGGCFTEPWHTSKSLRSMKGFEIPLTTPVSSSLQGTPCDHLQKFFFALAKVCTISGIFTSWFAPLYWKAALLKVTTAASRTKTRHWRFYIAFLDSYEDSQGLALSRRVANFLLATSQQSQKMADTNTSIPC